MRYGKIIRHVFFVFFLFSSFLSPLFASDEGLDLEDIFTETLSNHPNIQGKKNEYAAAAQSLESSKWQRWPSLSVATTSGQSSRTNSSTGVISTIRLDLPLWTAGRVSANIDSAASKTLASEMALLETEQSLLIKAANSYSDFLKFSKKLEASEESVKEHQRLLELIQRRSRNEVSSMNEIVLAKSRLDQAKSDKIQILSQINNAKSQLEQLVGHVIDKIKPPRFALILPENQNQAIQLALEYAPNLRRLSAQIKAAESDITVAKSRLFPELSARSDQIIGGVAEGNISYLALTFQPGNGLSVLSSTREFEFKKDVAESSLKSAEVEIKTNISADWIQYTSQNSQIETLSNLSETTRGVYESFVRQYAVGRKTWIEVLNARREATQARYSLADAEMQSFNAALKIQVACGILNGDSLMMPSK